MSVSPGSKLGAYSIDREIGRGGMGVVYLAHDERLDRPVAIKALPEFLGEDAPRLARFEREAKSLAQLSHPNVAGIYGVEEQDGEKYLVLEYVDGDTLADRLDGGPLPVDEALEYAIEIASGVEAAHEAGVIHRDLKPDNIKITLEGKVKVLDFGLAKSSDTISSSGARATAATVTTPGSPTLPGAILGSAPYMAPEQARGRSVDKRVDVWSFGVVLYEMLTGMSPFIGDTVSDSIGAILHKDIEFDRLPADTPPLVRHVLSRCLQRDKAKRLHDIADARLEIQAALDDPTASGHLGVADPSALEPPASTRLPALLVVAVLLVAVGFGAAWLVRRPAPAASTSVVRLSIPLPWKREDVGGFAFSSDGTMVVLATRDSATSPPTWTIRLRRLADDAFVTLHESTRNPGMLAFSPNDADLILGDVAPSGHQHFTRIPVDGRRPVPVHDADRDTYSLDSYATWLDDDEFMCFGRSGNTQTLHAISTRTGEPRALFSVEQPGIFGLVDPVALPGGEHVLYTHWGLDQDQVYARIMCLELSSGDVQVVHEDAGGGQFIAPGILTYHRENGVFAMRFDPAERESEGRALRLRDDMGVLHPSSRDVVYRRDIDAAGAISTIDADGNVEPLIPAPRWYNDYVAPSRDATRVAVRFGDTDLAQQFTIAVIETATGAVQRVDSGLCFGPAWMPDGGLSYVRLPEDNARMQVVEALIMTWRPGTTPRPLRDDLRTHGRYSFSPDGNSLVFYRLPEGAARDGAGDLVILDLTDDASQPVPYLATQADEEEPTFSPDGRWLAFASDVSGTVQIYVTPFVPGEPARPVRISIDGGDEPFWSWDSSELYFVADDTVMHAGVTPADDGSGAPVVSRPEILFTSAQVDASAVRVMPGDERFVFVDLPDRRPDDDHLFVVLNWAEELRRELDAE